MPHRTRTCDPLYVGKEKSQSQKVDLVIFAVRELGLNYPYFSQGIKHSKTGEDRKLKLSRRKKIQLNIKKSPSCRRGKQIWTGQDLNL